MLKLVIRVMRIYSSGPRRYSWIAHERASPVIITISKRSHPHTAVMRVTMHQVVVVHDRGWASTASKQLDSRR